MSVHSGTISEFTAFNQVDFENGCDNILGLYQHGLSNTSLVGEQLVFNQNDLLTRACNFVLQVIEQIAHDYFGATHNPRAFNEAKVAHIEDILYPQLTRVISLFKEHIFEDGKFSDSDQDMNAKIAMKALIDLKNQFKWGAYTGNQFSSKFWPNLHLNENYKLTALTPRAQWNGAPLTADDFKEIGNSKELSNSLPLSILSRDLVNCSAEDLVKILEHRNGVITGLNGLSDDQLRKMVRNPAIRAKLELSFVIEQVIPSSAVSTNYKKSCLRDLKEPIAGLPLTSFTKRLLKSRSHVQQMTAFQVNSLLTNEDALTHCKLLSLSQGEIRGLDYQGNEMLAFTIYSNYPKLVLRMSLQEQLKWISALPATTRVHAQRLMKQD